MTVNIEYEAKEKLNIPYKKIINDIIEESMDYEHCPYEAEINVILTDNDEIKHINKEYRNVESETDVLSFPMVEYDTPADFSMLEQMQDDFFNPDTGELILGDIVISVDKVKEQAEMYGHDKKRELAFLIAHSMLHLFGYDHMLPDERKIMEKKQEEILENRGYTR